MRETHEIVWPGPARGWVTTGNVATSPLDAADRLDNFFPTAEGAELRHGSEKHATLGATCARFMAHRYGSPQTLYGCTAADIYDITTPASTTTTPTATMTGLGSGDWAHIQFGNAAGTFMIGVNGTDWGVFHDGTDLEPLCDETIYNLGYDALTAAFAVGGTVTGGTSAATAEIMAIMPTSATAGTLKLGAITGTFQDNETITDGATGSATSNIPTGTSTAHTTAITGVETKALSQVWVWKQRAFFVEGGTQSIWYLPVDSIGGAASEINLGSIFNLGGNVLFGANWSLDSGEGLDDKLVVVTDQGEVAVYGGTDPASASTFTLDGVYRTGDPVDKHGFFSVGGELMIVTRDGIVAMSQLIARDRASTLRSAMSAPIEDVWQTVMSSTNASAAFPPVVAYWPTKGRLYVASPVEFESKAASFVANTRTGAWARYVGWDIRSAIIVDDLLYFGADGGVVYQGETSGADDGSAYTGVYIPKFSDCGTPHIKVANHVAIVSRTAAGMTFAAKVLRDFQTAEIVAPQPIAAAGTSSVWGTAVWGAFIWGQELPEVGSTKWKSVGANGHYLSPAIAITANQVAAPDVDVTAVKMRFEVGRAF